MINFPQSAGGDWRNDIKKNHGQEIPGQIDHDFFIDYAGSLMGEDVSGVRKSVNDNLRGVLKHPYNLRPLTQYESKSSYTAKHDGYNLNPLTAQKDDRQLWERTVGMAQRKTAWLDRHNSDLQTGTDYNGNSVNRKVDAITMREVRSNPTLSRILAGFALQDGENIPFSMAKNGSEKAPVAPVSVSPWNKTPAIQNKSTGVWGKIKSGLQKLKFW